MFCEKHGTFSFLVISSGAETESLEISLLVTKLVLNSKKPTLCKGGMAHIIVRQGGLCEESSNYCLVVL